MPRATPLRTPKLSRAPSRSTWLLLAAAFGFVLGRSWPELPPVTAEVSGARAMPLEQAPPPPESTPARPRSRPRSSTERERLEPKDPTADWKAALSIAAQGCAPPSGRALRIHVETGRKSSTSFVLRPIDAVPDEVLKCVRDALLALGRPGDEAVALTLVL
ncbi:MAG: hypothetical protein HYV07_04665 [Deltaproteobacteria bacterium]|nr:hypothetical protein [Deltaproteobacteria bacterium]